MIQNNGKNVLKFCKFCLNDIKEELVIILCRLCMECLCEGCISYYKKFIIIKDYDVVFLDEINKFVYCENEEEYCNKYDFRYLDLFCFDYDIFCCFICSVIEYKICIMDMIKKVFEKIEKENES